MTELRRLDDYNYPPLNRSDSIKNKPLNSYDFTIRKTNQINTPRDYSFNNYNLDIEGAYPGRYGFYALKEDYTNKNDDIEKSSPSPLYRYVNKPDYSISNQGIDGSYPRKMRNFSTSRNVNPLTPEYHLPTVTPSNFPPEVRKFLRDNLDVSDIEGAQPKPMHRKFYRDNMLTLSSDEARIKKKIDKRGIYDYIDYSDVSKKPVCSKRCCSPLDPIYNVRYYGGENYIYGDIEGSKPSSFSKFKKDCNTNLSTEDIIGAQADTKTFVSRWKNDHEGRMFSYSKPEIEKSQAESLIRGIITNRCINPVDPKYQFLDRNDIELNKINEKKNIRYLQENNRNNNLQIPSKDPKFQSEPNEYIKKEYTERRPNISPSNKKNRLIESYSQTDTNNDYMTEKEKVKQFISSLNVEKIPQIKPQFNKENYIIKGPYHPHVHDKILVATPPSNNNKFKQSYNQSSNNLHPYKNSNLSLNKPYEYQLNLFLKEKGF